METVTSKQVITLYNYIEQEGIVNASVLDLVDTNALKWLIKSGYIAIVDDCLFVERTIPE